MSNPTKVTVTNPAPVRKPPVSVTITCTEQRLRYLNKLLFKYENYPGTGIVTQLAQAMSSAGISQADPDLALMHKEEQEAND